MVDGLQRVKPGAKVPRRALGADGRHRAGSSLSRPCLQRRAKERAMAPVLHPPPVFAW